MPRATKSARPRLSSALSAPTQYSQPRAQSDTSSSSSSSSSYSHVWTAADAAGASRDGAFLTAWPRDQSYYTPPVHILGQAQGQSGRDREIQCYYAAARKTSAAPSQGGGGGK